MVHHVVTHQSAALAKGLIYKSCYITSINIESICLPAHPCILPSSPSHIHKKKILFLREWYFSRKFLDIYPSICFWAQDSPFLSTAPFEVQTIWSSCIWQDVSLPGILLCMKFHISFPVSIHYSSKDVNIISIGFLQVFYFLSLPLPVILGIGINSLTITELHRIIIWKHSKLIFIWVTAYSSNLQHLDIFRSYSKDRKGWRQIWVHGTDSIAGWIKWWQAFFFNHFYTNLHDTLT